MSDADADVDDTIDATITQKVRKKLRRRGFSEIAVSTKKGIVHLSGLVNAWEDVIAVGYAAAEIKGVREIVNDVTTKEARQKRKKPAKKPLSFYNPALPKKADVVIIGAGVIGCAIARELTRYKLDVVESGTLAANDSKAIDVVVLEKEPDVSSGASKANSGQVHTGIGEHSGTLKKELCAQAWPLYKTLSKELDFPYKQNGLLIVITKDTLPSGIPSFLRDGIAKTILPRIVARRGLAVGDTPRIITRNELFEMEKNLTKRALAGVFMPGYGITSPYKMTIAFAENAVQNGARIFLDTEVTEILVENGRVSGVVTNRGTILTKVLINAAGVHADDIAAMANAREFSIHGRKGSIIIFDKELGEYNRHQVSLLTIPQEAHTKGGAALMTVDGNPNWGPTAIEVPDKEDTSVAREELEKIFEKYSQLFPDFPRTGVITYFAGVRAATYTEEFVIKESEYVRGLIHAAGIQSPGLTAAPVIAKKVVDILKKTGVQMAPNERFNPVRKAPPVFEKATTEEKKKLIDENAAYGNIICRCEQVTEAEIVSAIHANPPALTVDAVKRRTRAGMGRCQGGFCGQRVAAILARELQIPLEAVVKESAASSLFIGESKALLKSAEAK